jgi:hypothetical protein
MLACLHSAAQETVAYTTVLESTKEISLNDSLYIDAAEWDMQLLDTNAVKQWFSCILPATPNNRLRNRKYFLAGKITSSNNFNLLILVEEKKRPDSSLVQVVYFISTKKDGGHIATLEAAVNGSRKSSSYITSSWLYKDFKILKDSKITVNDKLYSGITNYKINGGGRFILYPNY